MSSDSPPSTCSRKTTLVRNTCNRSQSASARTEDVSHRVTHQQPIQLLPKPKADQTWTSPFSETNFRSQFPTPRRCVLFLLMMLRFIIVGTLFSFHADVFRLPSKSPESCRPVGTTCSSFTTSTRTILHSTLMSFCRTNTTSRVTPATPTHAVCFFPHFPISLVFARNSKSFAQIAPSTDTFLHLMHPHPHPHRTFFRFQVLSTVLFQWFVACSFDV